MSNAHNTIFNFPNFPICSSIFNKKNSEKGQLNHLVATMVYDIVSPMKTFTIQIYSRMTEGIACTMGTHSINLNEIKSDTMNG